VPVGGLATTEFTVAESLVASVIVKPEPEGVPAEQEYVSASELATSTVDGEHEREAVGAPVEFEPEPEPEPEFEHCQLVTQFPDMTGCQDPVVHELAAGCCGCVEHCWAVDGVHGVGWAGGVGAMFVLPYVAFNWS